MLFPMAKKRKQLGELPASLSPSLGVRRKRPTRKLHLGPWLVRLGRKPVDVAKKIKIGESYMSHLISGKKKGTPTVLVEISEEIGITVNDLFVPPPPPEVTQAVEAMKPSELAALARALDKISRPKKR